jgi:hypothetical protein
MRSQIGFQSSGRTARRAAVVGAAGLLVITVGVGIASAAPGDDGEITACYHSTTGAMRAIDAGDQCKKNETRLVWSSGSAAALPDGSVIGGPGGVVADDTLSKDDLGSDSVESDELADDAVGTAELADDSVKGGSGGVVQDGGITVFDLAVDAVNGSKIEDGSVDTDDLSDGAVTSGKIEDGAVGEDDLSDGAVTSGKIEDGAVGEGDLSGDAVTSPKVVNGSITSGDLANGAATTDKLTANAAAGTTGPVDFTTPGSSTKTVSSVIFNASANHKLLVLGQAQLTCTPCGLGEAADVTWQVFEGGVPVSQEYRSVLSNSAPTTPVSVSALVPSSGSAGAHTYELRATVSSGALQTVTSTNDSLSVIDLGQ